MAQISVLNTTIDLSGKTLVTAEGDRTITGLFTFSRGAAAPFAAASGAAKVTNLDADKLDGQDGAYYTTAANLTGPLPAIDGSALTGINASPLRMQVFQ